MKFTGVLLVCIAGWALPAAMGRLQGSQNTKDYYIEATEKIKFELHTRENLASVETLSLEEEYVGHFNASRPTKILVHGWDSSPNLVRSLSSVFLDELDVNVLIMYWNALYTINYPRIVKKKVHSIARRLADLIDYVSESLGVPPEELHVIGHSLGSHISGLSSLYIKQGQLGRITGLDPAGPWIHDNPHDRLDKSHARFVDAMHTCGNVAGLRKPMGHADFYVNGGKCSQPGCLLLDLTTFKCSHNRAYDLFAESIVLNNSFVGVPSTPFKTNSWPCKDAEEDGERVVMGLGTPSSARGVFCLDTGESSPFGLGEDVFGGTEHTELSEEQVNLMLDGLMNGSLRA